MLHVSPSCLRLAVGIPIRTVSFHLVKPHSSIEDTGSPSHRLTVDGWCWVGCGYINARGCILKPNETGRISEFTIEYGVLPTSFY